MNQFIPEFVTKFIWATSIPIALYFLTQAPSHPHELTAYLNVAGFWLFFCFIATTGIHAIERIPAYVGAFKNWPARIRRDKKIEHFPYR